MTALRSAPTGSAAGDPYRPYRLVGTLLAVLVLCLAGLEQARNALYPVDRDFVSFWGAGRLALWGVPEGAYDREMLHALQAQAVTFETKAELPFAYPPAFLLLLLPFAAMPFAIGMAAWTLATTGGWLAVVRRMFPKSGWLALGFPPIFANAAIGQNGCLTASAFAGGLILLPRWPFLAGLVLGCLVLKPQLALLLPIALLAGWQWRAMAGAAASALALLLLGPLLFGTDATRGWIDQMPLYAEIARNGLVGWPKLASVYATAREMGVAASPALAIHAAVALLAAYAVWRVWRSDAVPGLKASILIAASLLASPYLFLYDQIILAVPLLWLAERWCPAGIVGALWLAPVAAIALAALGSIPINLGAIVPMMLVAVLWQRFKGRPAQ